MMYSGNRKQKCPQAFVYSTSIFDLILSTRITLKMPEAVALDTHADVSKPVEVTKTSYGEKLLKLDSAIGFSGIKRLNFGILVHCS
jgi:hypothetical protein